MWLYRAKIVVSKFSVVPVPSPLPAIGSDSGLHPDRLDKVLDKGAYLAWSDPISQSEIEWIHVVMVVAHRNSLTLHTQVAVYHGSNSPGLAAITRDAAIFRPRKCRRIWRANSF